MVKLKEGAAVWVKDAAIAKDNLFVVGHIVSMDGIKATVETEQSGKRQEIVVPLEECYHTNQGGHVPDHCQLVHLSQPTLLENTRARFEHDNIYTYVGDILVAINPFKWILGIYDESVMEQCKGTKLHNASCGPHVFAVSERAYVFLVKTGKAQCVVVSGESGSGKTETNRQLMNYLVWRGSTKGAANTLTQKILDANPILESFGNAKTTRNNNSSRFGRYTLVRFDESWGVAGAQVRVFLLERSRVTSASNAKERSYHAFYQLIKAGTKYVSPNDCALHKYTSFPGTEIDSPGIDDHEWFKECNDGFASVAVAPDEVDVVWNYVAAMLLMGNIDFGTGDHAAIADTATLSKIESALGISDGLQMLSSRKSRAPREPGMKFWPKLTQSFLRCDLVLLI